MRNPTFLRDIEMAAREIRGEKLQDSDLVAADPSATTTPAPPMRIFGDASGEDESLAMPSMPRAAAIEISAEVEPRPLIKRVQDSVGGFNGNVE